MMIYNILNGDALAYSFPDAGIEGEIVVLREALIAGDLSGDNLLDFWKTRAKAVGVSETEYKNYVVIELEKLIDAPDHSEFNLWFEYDLFCQVNMWFVISILNNLAINKKVYAVYSTHLNKSEKQFWSGFGQANSDDLRFCLTNKIHLSEQDLKLGGQLWKAYKNGNLEELKHLADKQSAAFPYLKEVVEAHIARFPKEGKGSPERVIEDIANTISPDFNTVFREFRNKESIYGFGDTQVREIYDKLNPLSP